MSKEYTPPPLVVLSILLLLDQVIETLEACRDEKTMVDGSLVEPFCLLPWAGGLVVQKDSPVPGAKGDEDGTSNVPDVVRRPGA